MCVCVCELKPPFVRTDYTHIMVSVRKGEKDLNY